MALARWQSTIVDGAGNVQPGATVTVRREVPGAPLAQIYSDRAGTTPKSNPFPADGTGLAAFHAIGGAYRIDATKGGFSQTFRYVAVGTAAEADFGIQLIPRGPWEVGTTYTIGEMVEHNGYLFGSNIDANIGNEPNDAPASDEFWTLIPTQQGPPGIGDKYTIGLSVNGLPRAGEVMVRHEFEAEVVFPDDMAESRASSDVVSDGERLFVTHDPDMGWGQYAHGGIDVREIPGSHLRLFHPSHVGHLAGQLQQCLNEAQLVEQNG